VNTLAKLLALAERCRLCPRQCGANRLAGEKGFCQAGRELQVSYIGLHQGEEPPISGTQGSGTVFFGYCTMACVFCQNWQISQQHNNLRAITPEQLAAEFLRLQNLGAHNINLVSPTQYAPFIYQAWETAKQNGLTLPVVYNTNGYERPEVLELLGGMIDIYLPDRKYAENISAEKYSGAPDYAEQNLAALKFMLKQKGLLQIRNDLAVQGVIVRHLVLPGLGAESKKILTELTALNPELQISLMSQYAPHYLAKDRPEINRKLSAAEYNAVLAQAEVLGLENVWVQEPDSQEIFVPDFRKEQPFS